MKKVLMILLALAMVFSMAGVVSADEVAGESGDSGKVEVSHTIPDNCVVSMPVTIPLSVADNYEQITSEVTLTVTKLQVTTGKSLYVTMTSGNEFQVKDLDGDSFIEYSAGLQGEDGTYSECTNGQVVLTASEVNAAASMKFFATQDDINAAKDGGKHTDTLTFTYSFVGTQANVVEDVEDIISAAAGGQDVLLTKDVEVSASQTTANSGYGATGVVVDGNTFDGNGQTLTVTDAWNTWDCAVNPKSGTIKNLVINSGMRGIFMSGANGDVYVDNVVIDGTVYTFNSDAGSKDYGVYISDSTLNGWTSFSDCHKEVIFTNCNFGEGSGYAFCRPYNNCTFDSCTFEEGFMIDIRADEIVVKNCYYGNTLITEENAASLYVTSGEGEGAESVYLFDSTQISKVKFQSV